MAERGSALRSFAGALLLGIAAMIVPAHAFDAQSSSGEGQEKGWTIFKFGFSAYKSGRKSEALEAYRDAAKQGHTGARWKLANMYAAGDGTPEDDYEAFKLYEGIVSEGPALDSQDSTYVANALVAIGGYIRRGIPNSPVKANAQRARDVYMQAAVNFGEPNAQFELGRMYLNGEGGEPDRRQAGRWFKLAASKGHAGARAMLGQMLFEAGRTTEGLGMMTAALEAAHPQDRDWIRTMQEEAFAVSSEAERRTAIAYGEKLAAQ